MKGPTSVRKDPACGTCRKKCRKCDRKRPVCQRCVDKGLHCEGYPPRFKFFDQPSEEDALGSTLNDENEPPHTELATAPEDAGQVYKKSSSSPGGLSSPQEKEASSTAQWTPPHPSEFNAHVFQHDEQEASADYPTTPVEDILPGNEWLLAHFEEVMVDALAITVSGMENPFRQHVIPLAKRHGGVLYALLGLSSCHVCTSHRVTGLPMMAIALQHRIAAIHILKSTLLREEAGGLESFEEECVLAIVLLLVLHDICETGISSRGAHLNGVSFLCGRMARSTDLSHPSKSSTLFFMATLSWLDVLRGFSGAEKLAYPDVVRRAVEDHWSFSLYMTFGCPAEIFHCIGSVIETAKSYTHGLISEPDFRSSLDKAETFLREWNPERAVYPTADREWRALATAFRHACLLRIMRWPDTFAVPCENERIKESVAGILDACSLIHKESPYYKRLLFPLFLAASDASSLHQRHYAELSIEQIKQSTGIQHHSLTKLLQEVFEERKTGSRGWANVPWMEFTCSSNLGGSQHAFLFF